MKLQRRTIVMAGLVMVVSGLISFSAVRRAGAPLPTVEVMSDPHIKNDLVIQEPVKVFPRSPLARWFNPARQRAQSFNNTDPAQMVALEQTIRNATVNILCREQLSGKTSYTTGSGFIIDSSGIIMTNAHVAQHLLLSEYGGEKNTTCYARTGNPAQTHLALKLLYIPQKWVEANHAKYKTPNPTGTGEYDYALIKIDSPLGTVYPHLSVATETDHIPQAGSVIVAGYPAGNITLSGLLYSLPQQLTQSHIQDTYTFAYTTYDLMSIPAGNMAQRGISGGVVTDTTGKVIGIVATAERRQPAAKSVVNAVTFSHINNSFKAARGVSLASFVTAQNRYAQAKQLAKYKAQLAQGQAVATDGVAGTTVAIPWQEPADDTTSSLHQPDTTDPDHPDGPTLTKEAIPHEQPDQIDTDTTSTTPDTTGEATSSDTDAGAPVQPVAPDTTAVEPPPLQDFVYLSSLYRLPVGTQ